MFNLHRRKVVSIVSMLFIVLASEAQEHNPLYDNKPVRFGFGITGIQAKMKFSVSPDLVHSDTLQRIESESFPGLGLGGLVNIKLAKNLDLRVMLNIQLVQRNLNYHFKSDKMSTAKIESTYMEVPVLLKYKSNRHRNWRMYVIGGFSYRYDFISDIETERSNTKPIVALYPNTLSYDIGFGISYYHNFAKISPEIRLTNALGNHLVPDQYIFSSSLASLSPKLIQFSIIFN